VAHRAHDRQRNISGGRKVPKKLSLLRLLAAGNFNDNIVRRLRRRVLLSHDLSAFTAFAY
jgi:hypothetical protein